jgi:hypothetical protein
VIDHPHNEDLRGLFDWRRAAARVAQPGDAASSPGLENDDLVLALQLLACNSRDREQFVGAHRRAAAAA